MNDVEPLIRALQERNLSEVWNLISDQPSLVQVEAGSLSPLHLAAQTGEVALARVLLDYGADLEAVHAHTWSTPLKYAVFFGKTDMVEFLVQRGANLENRGGGSATPLELAHKAPSEQFRRMGTTGSDRDYAVIARFLQEQAATGQAKP